MSESHIIDDAIIDMLYDVRREYKVYLESFVDNDEENMEIHDCTFVLIALQEFKTRLQEKNSQRGEL